MFLFLTQKNVNIITINDCKPLSLWGVVFVVWPCVLLDYELSLLGVDVGVVAAFFYRCC